MKAKKALATLMTISMLAFSLTGWAEEVPETITVTFVSSPLNVPSIVEKNHEIFADTFSEIGVKAVEYSDLTSGADQTQALATGDIQFLYIRIKIGVLQILLFQQLHLVAQLSVTACY